jgi:choline transport protein
VTRDIWSFSRDQGLPFSNWLSRVDKKRKIPVHATSLTSLCSIGLSLIYIGSPVAFYAITSLLTVALLQCYCLSIGCLLWRRIKYPHTLPPSKFSLGRWGVPLNIAAVLYALWAFFWFVLSRWLQGLALTISRAFWPTYNPVTAAGFNWASVLFVTTLLFAALHYVFVARKKYVGPVAMIEGRKLGYREELVAPMAATS